MADFADRQLYLDDPAKVGKLAQPEPADQGGWYKLNLGAKVYYVVMVHGGKDVTIVVAGLGGENDLGGQFRNGWSHDGRSFFGPEGLTNSPTSTLLARPSRAYGQLMVGFSQTFYPRLSHSHWKDVFQEPGTANEIWNPINLKMQRYAFTPKSAGYMYFMMNDVLKGMEPGYSDNRGFLKIEMTGVSAMAG